STGQTFAQLPPRILASRMRRAEPRRFPVLMRLINPGTSIWVGQAAVQGASKQFRQRLASMTAAWGASGGLISVNRSRSSRSSGMDAVLMKTSGSSRTLVCPPGWRQTPVRKGMSNRRYRTETSLGKSEMMYLKHFRQVCPRNQWVAIDAENDRLQRDQCRSVRNLVRRGDPGGKAGPRL